MPILFMHNNDNQQSHSESRVKKILSHVPSSVLSHRIGFSKSSSSSSVSSTTSDKLPQLSSRSTASNSSNESKEVLNEDGFAEPKKFLYPKAKIQEMLAWRSPQGPGAGLHNHGNTCFLNSVVQCITHTPPLANYLLSKEHSRSCKTVGFCMMCILEKHVARATSTGGAISPQEIVQNLRKIAPGFRPGRQEDAHEFLRFVIEGAQKSCLVHLQKEKVPPREAQTTVIGNIFGGYLQSQVSCIFNVHSSSLFIYLLFLF
jgi:ubiquitin carboxyl-terminal hydrolase 36/42